MNYIQLIVVLNINHGANESFSKHEINLMEFIDLYEAYIESEVQNSNLQYNCLMGKENINYSVGKDIFK